MKRTQNYDANRGTTTEQIVYYMPGTPRLAAENGRIERFVKSLLRRRGGLRSARKRSQETPR